MKATEKTLSIKHNMFWNTVGSLTNLGCQWLITILVVRLSDGYSAAGIYSLAMSIFNMFSQLAQYRMYTVQIADVERKNSAGEYLTFRFFTTFIAFAMLAVYSIATCRIGTVPAILLYALYKTAGLVIDVMHANDQVGHRMDYIGKSLIMQGIGSLLSFILVFGFFNSLEGALLLMTVVTIGIGVIYDYPRSNRISAIKLGISRAKVRAFLCSCLPIVLGGIAASAAPNIPRQYLSYSFGDSALGIYASVAAPVAIIQMGATYIYNPLLGYLVERYHSREKSFFSLIGKILAGIFFVGVISSVALFFFGKLLLSLFYGAGIAKHTDLLQPMLACAFLTGIAWFVNDLLVSLDNYRGVFVGSMLSLISAVAVMAPAQMLFGLNGPTVSALISNAICLIYQSSVLGKQTQQWFGERDRPMMSKAHALLKLQNTELDILQVVAAFCSKHGIRWWLDGGTCLGAMRHRGFIPWDDDIDIGMMRSDYDRFCSLAEGGLPEGYSLHTSRNTTGYAAMFAKVYRDGTRFENQEAREASSSMGIFVDIFPYDQLYTDKRLRAKQVRTASIAQKRAYLYHSSSIVVPHKGFLGQLEQIGCSAMHVVEQLVSRGACSYQDLFDSCIADSNTGEVSDYCLTLSWPNMAPVPISEIFPLSSAVFEGSEFPVPRMTDKYLTTMYGDWKKIPSPDNRHTHLPLLLDFGDGEVWTAQN